MAIVPFSRCGAIEAKHQAVGLRSTRDEAWHMLMALSSLEQPLPICTASPEQRFPVDIVRLVHD
jgi:hypothetical protein